MEIPIELPLDADGFIRRECPHCEQEFKWHHGPTEDAPEDFVYPPVYWCPRCGQSATDDRWWTPAQVEYQQAVAAGPIHDLVLQELGDVFKSTRNSFIKFDVTGGERPEIPDPLVEPDDMVMVSSPCHPWEPVKVPEGAEAPYYCLVCGEEYAV